MPILPAQTDAERADSVEEAAQAVRRGQVVVLPTDTVYGIGADAFNHDAVATLLTAKGRGRSMPPPVLVPTARTVDGLARDIPAYARALMDEFWPGALTLIFRSHASLHWDLGDTNGTVALRQPEDPTALALLELIGPMAVSSANTTAAPTAQAAYDMLGEVVAVYLDAGPSTGTAASTILDCTGAEPTVLRSGAISEDALWTVITPHLESAADEPESTPTVDLDKQPPAQAADASAEDSAAPDASVQQDTPPHTHEEQE